jgi:hypothetical protein
MARKYLQKIPKNNLAGRILRERALSVIQHEMLNQTMLALYRLFG